MSESIINELTKMNQQISEVLKFSGGYKRNIIAK